MKDVSRITAAPNVSVSHVKTNMQEHHAFQIHNISKQGHTKMLFKSRQI